MSHNNTKVGGQSPNIQGNVTVGLNDLSDVSAAAPTTGQLIQYSSGTASWSAVDAPSSTVQHIWIGGKAKAYSNSPATSFNAGQTVYIWDDAPINTITGASISVTSGSATADENDWVQSITLPAGNYVFRVQTMFEFSASGYGVYQMFTSAGTAVTAYGVVGDSRGVAYGPSNSTARGFVQITSSTTYNLEMVTSSNIDSIANQGNTPSEFGLIFIEKVE